MLLSYTVIWPLLWNLHGGSKQLNVYYKLHTKFSHHSSSYLYNLIILQLPRGSRCSSTITLCPSSTKQTTTSTILLTASSLKSTDCSFISGIQILLTHAAKKSSSHNQSLTTAASWVQCRSRAWCESAMLWRHIPRSHTHIIHRTLTVAADAKCSARLTGGLVVEATNIIKVPCWRRSAADGSFASTQLHGWHRNWDLLLKC